VLGEGLTVPLWLILAWVGGYASANGGSLGSLDAFLRAPGLPAAGVANFRAFATRQGVTIPADPEADAVLQRVLAEAVARAKWGDGAAYSVEALTDPEVRAAVKTFERATALLGPAAAR
jgi:hypothetical protein